MSEFILTINQASHFQIYKSEAVNYVSNALVVGRRDPDQQYEWKLGGFYYNPYYERQKVFVYRADQKLVSIEGHPAARDSLKDPKARTWFEVIPQPLRVGSLPVELKNMIEAIPQQVKAISQALMQNLGVRVPANFEPKVDGDWFEWLATVSLPLGGSFKTALQAGDKPVIVKEHEIEFLTGKIVAPTRTIHVRMIQIREIVKRVRQIHETAYLAVNIPTDVLALGPTAVREWIKNDPVLAARFTLMREPTSEKLLKEEEVKAGPTEIVGFSRDQNYKWTNLWPDQLTSVQTANDLIREIMEEIY